MFTHADTRTMNDQNRHARTFLPLPRSTFHVLLTLHGGVHHGYAIKQQVEEVSGGVVRLGPGTLYTTLQKCERQGLIEESNQRPPPSRDQSQRRYYAITSMGRRVLEAEVARLGSVVDLARAALAGRASGAS